MPTYSPRPPFVDPKATPIAKAADATLTAAEVRGNNITNSGAAGIVTLILPPAGSASGAAFRLQVTAAQIVRLDPAGTEKIYLGGSGVAGKYTQIPGVIGNYAMVSCDGIDWIVGECSGLLVKEP